MISEPLYQWLGTLNLPGWESFAPLWILFPLVPLVTAALLILDHSLLGDRLQGFLLPTGILAQFLLGLALLLMSSSLGPEIRTLELSLWPYSILFQFDGHRPAFLVAYLIPLGLSLLKLRHLEEGNIRILFVFYLVGCSGLIVTGDIFNFYVFYELMIMGAYVLISINRDYGASVKYMVFGALSSALFLGGIVVLYGSGAGFGFQFYLHEGISAPQQWWMLLLFFLAFGIKAAFFPLSSWVAPCHSATNSLVSAFLASFTIFSGIRGLYYMVLLPADHWGFESFFLLLRVLSLATLPAGALFLFWEKQFKRVVAASTVFTVGIIGLLLSYREWSLALMYLMVHAFYKSLLFFLSDDMEQQGDRIHFRGVLPPLFLLLGVLFTAGLFPSLTAFLKREFLLGEALYKSLFLVSAALVAGGFGKFRYVRDKGKSHGLFYLGAFLILGGLYFVFPWQPLLDPWAMAWNSAADAAILLAAFFLAGPLFRSLPALQGLDRTVYGSMNRQLLYILILALGLILALLALGAVPGLP